MRTAPAAAAPAAAGALHVFVACNPWVMAVPTAYVERLLLADEARLHPAETAMPAQIGLVATDAALHSAWDLGTLLGLPPHTEAWVLLRLPRPGGALPVALRTGPCLSTGPLPASSVALPQAIAQARRGVLTSAFEVPAMHRARAGGAVVGLALELAQLWTEAELEAAEAALRADSAERA